MNTILLRKFVSPKRLTGVALVCASFAFLVGFGTVRAEASSHGCRAEHAKRINPRHDGRISGNYKHGPILITRRKVRFRDSAGTLFVTDAYYACHRSSSHSASAASPPPTRSRWAVGVDGVSGERGVRLRACPLTVLG